VLGINKDPDDALVLYQAGAERLTIANGGVSIAGDLTLRNGSIVLATPSESARMTFYRSSNTQYVVIQTDNKSATLDLNNGRWTFGSDAALKTDVVAHEPVLERVMKLRPVRFRWKADGSDSSGFIAQEVEALFPDLVHEGMANEATGRQMKSLAYDRFGMLAVAAIKELKTDHDARLDALERKLAAQEGKS
jgi:hypothetical protein